MVAIKTCPIQKGAYSPLWSQAPATAEKPEPTDLPGSNFKAPAESRDHSDGLIFLRGLFQ